MSYEIQFPGIILFPDLHHVPSEWEFWSTQPDLQVEFISNEVLRNRQLKIKQYIHPANNQNLEYDAFIQKLKNSCIIYSKLSAYESIVPRKVLNSRCTGGPDLVLLDKKTLKKEKRGLLIAHVLKICLWLEWQLYMEWQLCLPNNVKLWSNESSQ